MMVVYSRQSAVYTFGETTSMTWRDNKLLEISVCSLQFGLMATWFRGGNSAILDASSQGPGCCVSTSLILTWRKKFTWLKIVARREVQAVWSGVMKIKPFVTPGASREFICRHAAALIILGLFGNLLGLTVRHQRSHLASWRWTQWTLILMFMRLSTIFTGLHQAISKRHSDDARFVV